MKQIVFYSWQSDLPNACNRGFIQRALEDAAAAIKADDSVEIEPVVDRDTLGVPGAPDIASTIFGKITAADAFVADVSIVNRGGKRASPNPNVLIELGYALKALGHERVVLVFNREFGGIEELPFDLKMRRVLGYDMPAHAEGRATERSLLGKQLDAAIRSALGAGREARPATIPAVAAIENQQPNRIIILRRNLAQILTALEEHEPKKHSEVGIIEPLITALASTQETVAEFSKIAETISLMNDLDAAIEVLRSFGRIFQQYDLPENFSGRFGSGDFDYFKFLGHELFVTFVSFLLVEQRWEMLEKVLAEPIPVRYVRRKRGPGNVEWSFASQHLPTFIDEGNRRRRVSLHADTLNERHTSGGLAAIMPIDDFADADYLLFLRGVIPPQNVGLMIQWRPWSALYLKHSPMFLRRAEYRNVANSLAKFLGAPSVDELKKRLSERTPEVERMFADGLWASPLEMRDIEGIGSL